MSDSQHLLPEVLRGESSIYNAMSQLAREHGAVDLAQGYPTYAGPEAMRQVAANSLLHGSQQYTDPRGTAPLRRALAHSAEQRYGIALDEDTEVTTACGAQGALTAAMLGLLQPGDEVVFIEPFYNPVVPMARRAGATLRFVALREPEFLLHEDELLAAMSERTKLIVFNNPNNPSGHVFRREELTMLARACEKFDAYLIADEVYEHLVYPGQVHTSALEIPELRDRCIVISSISKSYLMTGWRVGWAMGAAPLVAGVRKVSALFNFCLPENLSEGARFALEELPSDFLVTLADQSCKKRDLLCNGLSELGFRVNVPEGTFFCSVDIGDLGEGDDLAFCKSMAKNVGVAAVPMSLSWHERRHATNLIRLCFAREDEDLLRALDNMRTWLAGR